MAAFSRTKLIACVVALCGGAASLAFFTPGPGIRTAAEAVPAALPLRPELVDAVKVQPVDWRLSQSVASSKTAWEKYHYQSARECKKCHTNPTVDYRDSLDIILLTEYSIWQTFDKHAQAYAVLSGSRSKKIGERLKQEVTKPETGCLNCHAMDNLIKINKDQNIMGTENKEILTLDDGVSCGGCHGPSGAKNPQDSWQLIHVARTWREMTPEQKYKAGMRDLRDPIARAEMCTSCHIGNASEGKVVTHAMMAAGHPPLPPIEVATFSKVQPQHWRNANKVPAFQKDSAFFKRNPDLYTKNYHLQDVEFNQTRFALLGTVVAVRETVRLAKDRADFATPYDPKIVWPELLTSKEEGDLKQAAATRWPEVALAHSDCFGCHHDLPYPGFRQTRGFGYFVAGMDPWRLAPGRPLVRPWSLTPLGLADGFADKKVQDLRAAMKTLADATNARPFGRPEEMKQSADTMINYCNGLLNELRTARFTRAKAIKLAQALCDVWDKADSKNRKISPDYETARLMGSLLLVVCEELNMKSEEAQKQITGLRDYLNTDPYYNRTKRVGVLLDVVREALGRKKDDAPFNAGIKSFGDYLVDISNEENLKKQIGGMNPFLATMAQDFENKKFTAEMAKPAIIEELQRLSDAEMIRVLNVVNDYDPEVFKKRLRDLARAIPKQ